MTDFSAVSLSKCPAGAAAAPCAARSRAAIRMTDMYRRATPWRSTGWHAAQLFRPRPPCQIAMPIWHDKWCMCTKKRHENIYKLMHTTLHERYMIASKGRGTPSAETALVSHCNNFSTVSFLPARHGVGVPAHGRHAREIAAIGGKKNANWVLTSQKIYNIDLPGAYS